MLPRSLRVDEISIGTEQVIVVARMPQLAAILTATYTTT